MKQIMIIVLLVFFSSIVSAQRILPPALQQQLAGKRQVRDIMSTVRSYYNVNQADGNSYEGDQFENSEFYWWKRWEYWAMRRLLPDGTMGNYQALNYEAAQEVESRFAPQLQSARTSINTANAWASESPDHANRITGALLSYGNWSFLGPANAGADINSQNGVDILGLARMDRISFDPVNANIMYTGSPSGGVYKTTNGGTSWFAIGDGLPSGVACIQVSKANANVLYVFTGDGDSHRAGYLVFDANYSPISGGMYKSLDAGTSWIKCADMYTGAGSFYGYNIAVAQNNSNFLLVATSQGLYRSVNGGSSWDQVRTGKYFDVEFRPNDDSTIYASTASTISLSTNGGRTGTWSASTLSPAPSPTPERIDLGVRYNNTGAVSTFVYALCSGSSVSGTFSGLYRSTNSGASYSQQSNSPNILASNTAGTGTGSLGDYGNGVCVNPSNANIIATSSLCVWRSDGANGGTSMVYASTYREGNGPAAAYTHPDIHDVQYNPLNNNLYTTTDGGVWRSADDGLTWTDISTGLNGTQFYHMRMKDSDGNGEMNGLEIIAGAQDNGLKYRNPAGSWIHFYCCDGFDGVIKGSDGNYVVANINDSWKRSSNGGTNITDLGSITFFTPFAIDYNNDLNMYAASSSLRKSVDGFQTFSTVAVNLNNFITACPSNSNRLYGSSNTLTNLRISEDQGSTWTTISGNTGWPGGSPVITDCKPSLTNSAIIYASFGGFTDNVKVYRSTDAGANWTNYTGSLPNTPVHSLCVASEGVYAGTEIGVFFRAAGAADWTPFYTGMPKAIVTDIWVNENGLVYASTFGRGIWIASRYSACSADITVSGTLDGPNYFEASSTATVTANSQSGATTEIFVKSNGYIDLKEGFEIKNATFFQAYLGPCGTGGIPGSGRAAMQASISEGSNIIEYGARKQQQARRQESLYYALQPDGIEINLPLKAVVSVQAINVENGQAVNLFKTTSLAAGMYRIITGAGKYSLTVFADGKPVKLLKEDN